MHAPLSRPGYVLRIVLACLFAALVSLALLRLQHAGPASAPESALAAGAPPPAEARPPSIRPSIKWLPESPRYQMARREHYAASQAVRERLDLSLDRVSRRQHYRVRVVPTAPPQRGVYQSWDLQVATADGQPLAGAQLNVTGGMPQHGHGMPSQPKVRSLAAAGAYRVDGLDFSMPGWWELHVYVSKDRVDDIATFNLIVE